MGIRAKIVSIVVGVTCAYLLFSYVVSEHVILPGFEQMERSAAGQNVARCKAAISREVKALDSIAVEWSSRDETCEFIEGYRPTYVQNNFGRGMYLSSDLDLVMIYDMDGNCLAGNIFDPQAGGFVTDRTVPERMSSDSPFFRAVGDWRSVKGIVSTDHGPMMIASRPVLAARGRGPKVGSVVVGRFLNYDRIETLSEQVGVDLTICDLYSSGASSESLGAATMLGDSGVVQIHDMWDRMLRGETAIAGVDGNPVILVEVWTPRNIARRGRAIVNYVHIVAGVGTIIMLGGLLFVFRETIINPILHLTDEAATIELTGDLSRRTGLDTDDELGKLSHQFDQLLGTLEESRDELDRTNRELSLEIRHREKIDTELQRANEQLRKLAATDEMTGLANRRFFLQLLEHDFECARREGSAMSIAMIDVDNFKEVNDTWGHMAGDRVLRQIATALAEKTRSSDVLARYAGDEFVLLMPWTTPEGAIHAADRMRQTVEELTITEVGHKIRSTVSIGIHTARPCEGATIDEMISLADETLYDAKQTRNVVRHTSDIPYAA
jgi:diguanylate cyclase (GGDEF)-like protein